jgi:hypothetical protein
MINRLRSSAVAAGSLKLSGQAGQIIEMGQPPCRMAAPGIEPGPYLVYPKAVDDYVLVSEEEIKAAINLIIETRHMLIGRGSRRRCSSLSEGQRVISG